MSSKLKKKDEEVLATSSAGDLAGVDVKLKSGAKVSGKTKPAGARKVASGIKCYSRYNNAGYVYKICGDPYIPGKAKVKGPPRGEFSAYFRGENTKGPVERYYMAPQIDPADFLMSMGKPYRELTIAQQNEYQRLDKAKRRANQFRAIAEAGETGSGKTFQEYLKKERQDKIQERILENERKALQKGKEKLRNKFERKGVTVATTEKEIQDYFSDLLDRQVKRLNNVDRQERVIQNRIESREVEVKSKIAEAKDDIVNYITSFDGGDLYKTEYAGLRKDNQEFLTKSGLIGNNMVKSWLFSNKGKDIDGLIDNWKKFIFQTPNKNRQNLLVRNASDKKLRELIQQKFIDKTPFHAENKLPEGQKEAYNKIIETNKSLVEANMLSQFKQNYPKYIRDLQERMMKGEKERLEGIKEDNIARAKNQLKVAQREAQEKGKDYKWINKYVKLTFDIGDTLDNIEKKIGEGYDIPVKVETTLKDVMTSSKKLIDDITEIEDTISAIDRKKEKSKEDYETAIDKLKDKKKKATLLKKRKNDLSKLDAERVIEMKKQRKEAIKLAKIQKRYSKVADDLKKDINNQAGKSEDAIDKILKNIDKSINKAKEGADTGIQIKLEPAPPPIPFNIKGKKATTQQMKEIGEALINEQLGIKPKGGQMSEGKKKRKNKKSVAKEEKELKELQDNLKAFQEAEKRRKEKKKAQASVGKEKKKQPKKDLEKLEKSGTKKDKKDKK